MRKRYWHWVQASFQLFLLCISTTSSNANSTCADVLKETACNCTEGPDLWLQINCVLLENQNLVSLLELISSSSLQKIDRIAIKQCLKEVEVLDPLPKLQIRELEICNCGIKRVHERAFDNLTNSLEVLNLANNSITILPFLKPLRKLQSINFNRNLLKDIPERSFDGLDKLRQVRLKSNRICLLLPNALVETKNTLEFLDLSNNCFATIPAQNLRNHASLTHLSLAGNQIGDIAQMQFMNLPKLLELRLSFNRIKGIAPNGFMNVPQLKRFLAQNNLLTSIDGQTLQGFKQLEVIDLSGNHFAKLPSIKDHSNLLQLKMNNNKISKIDTLAFSANPKLELIDLHNNQISIVARNSFDSLNGLTTLNLANNSLEFIERNMFDGIRNLKTLILRANQIADINNAAFLSTSNLVVIDLSDNKLQKIRTGTFAKLSKIFSLDLSNNLLSIFERGAFEARIANFILDGNRFNCDAEFDQFVAYLVKNQARAFFPNQPDIKCVSPPENEGKRLRELMMEKASETHVASEQDSSTKFDLVGLLQRTGTSGVQGGEANSIQAVRRLSSSGQSLDTSNNNSDLIRAREQVANLFTRIASGTLPAAELNQLIKSIPSLVVNIPGLGNIDVSKLPPNVIEHVLRGGDVPGIPRQTLDSIIKQYMENMYQSVAIAQSVQQTDSSHLPADTDSSKYLSPINELQPRIIPNVMNGESVATQLPNEHYTQQNGIEANGGALSYNLTELFSPKVIQMMKLLPRGYNLSKLPPEIMKSVMAGDFPDLSLLPMDLQQYIMENLDDLLKKFSPTDESLSISDILEKLPKFEHAVGTTFRPYDLTEVEGETVIQSTELDYVRLYTALGLGLVGAVTLVILGLFCYYVKRNRPTSTNLTYG
ncbi:leucine rich repeat domain-containing protein [Ditylenchus destructor]|nr:leucine rich repeat domain-containing protein [Ditylenchus destructor]